ncbi:hypothetical protein [Bremerella sp. P1]|uniref:hypothetical protein n=1 Tax=Bremerella sp. P1 TaxID=3026424 RepID=UPI002367FAE4|nr:hypothetical protein [Bremerella sp. P1]WDI41834.1 hypothetical protein PSR63_25615 [Bremerella sp. P1]
MNLFSWFKKKPELKEESLGKVLVEALGLKNCSKFTLTCAVDKVPTVQATLLVDINDKQIGTVVKNYELVPKKEGEIVPKEADEGSSPASHQDAK